MAKDSGARIDDRNSAAAIYLPRRGVFGRAFGTMGLVAANSFDRVVGLFTDRRQSFIGGTIVGAIRGAVYGGLLAFLSVALFSAAAASGGVVFAVAMGVGAAIFAMHDGQAALDWKLNANNKGVGDAIARASGAIPVRQKSLAKEWEENHPKGQHRKSDWVKREDARQAALAKQVVQPGVRHT